MGGLMSQINLRICTNKRSFDFYSKLKSLSTSKIIERVESIDNKIMNVFNFKANLSEFRIVDLLIDEIIDNDYSMVFVNMIPSDCLNSDLGFIVIVFNNVSNGVVKKHKINIPISECTTKSRINEIITAVFGDKRTDCDDRFIIVDKIFNSIQKVVNLNDKSDFLELVGDNDFAEKIYEWNSTNSDIGFYQSVIVKKHKRQLIDLTN